MAGLRQSLATQPHAPYTPSHALMACDLQVRTTSFTPATTTAAASQVAPQAAVHEVNTVLRSDRHHKIADAQCGRRTPEACSTPSKPLVVSLHILYMPCKLPTHC